eukprot:g1750.t1
MRISCFDLTTFVQVLRQNFPGTLLLPDVCSLETLPKGCELLVAGFPCIDISRAGLRKGFEGQSSGLVRHVFRLLQDAKDRNRPVPWVLLENVEALLDRGVNGVPYVKSIADTFEAIGYSSWAHRVICSAGKHLCHLLNQAPNQNLGFGIPNRRSRVFFLASLYGDARDVLLAQGPQCCLGSCLDDYQENGVSGLCYECFQEDMSMKENAEHSFALDLGNARSAPGVDVVPTFTTHNDRICLLLGSKQMGMLRIQDAERLQGFPEGFTEPCFPIQQPGLNSHKNRQIKETEIDAWESKRYALLGNAVTVKVAEWLGERLSLPYKFKYVPCDRDKALALEFQNQHKFRKPGYIDLDMVDDSMEGLLVKSSKPHTNSNSTSLQMDEDSVETAERNGTTNSKANTHSICSILSTTCFLNFRLLKKFGVEDLSECPKKVPFQPLGKFITQVGKLPGPDAINTYIMRLREQGWNVENIVNKATKCGMKFHKEVSEVVRMEGFVNDCDQIGDLVWCVCRITKVWWPGYMLDPFDLPTGLDIPQSAIDNLTLVERKAWLPIEYWEDDQEAVFGPKTENQTKKEQDLMKTDQRKILVIFFGDNCHDWAYPHDVLDFNKYQNEKEGEAQSLEQSGNLKRPKLFWKALNEAHLWQEVKKKKNKGSGCISAVASRAASLAAAENRKPRCGNCEACLNRLNGGSTFSRRCLYVRAQAAAAAGHVGAQVAIHREKAIGAKVELYWPLDQKWFPGTVTGFDMLRLRHTVLYEDGDREIIALWSPCQLVRVLNKPKDWPESAKEIEQQQQQQQEKQKSTKIVQQELDQTVKTEMTDYEANRQEKIQKNKELLSSVFEQITDDGVTQVKEASLSKLIQLSTNTKEQSTERRNSDIEQVTLDEEEAEQEEEEEEVEQENEKMLCDIDIFAMLELGGPCRHTRSARRELTEFLSDDKNDRAHTPAAKRTKIIDSREIHDP